MGRRRRRYSHVGKIIDLGHEERSMDILARLPNGESSEEHVQEVEDLVVDESAEEQQHDDVENEQENEENDGEESVADNEEESAQEEEEIQAEESDQEEDEENGEESGQEDEEMSEDDEAIVVEDVPRSRRFQQAQEESEEDDVQIVEQMPRKRGRPTLREIATRRSSRRSSSVENEENDEDDVYALGEDEIIDIEDTQAKEPARRGRGRRRRHHDDDEEENAQPASHYSFRDRSLRQPRSFFQYSPSEPPKRKRRGQDETVSVLEKNRTTQALDRATRYAMRQRQLHGEESFLEQNSKPSLMKKSRSSKRVQELMEDNDSVNAGSDSQTATNAGYSLRNRNTIRRTVSSYDDLTQNRTKQSGNAYNEYLSRRKKENYYSQPQHHHHSHLRRRKHSASSSDDDEDRIVKRHKRELNAILPVNDSGNIAQLRADVAPVQLDKSVTWDSVGGLKSHIDALKEMVMLPMLYPEFYSKYGVTPPSGVLFYGPPGTGKTLMARALANSCSDQQITFYMRKGADCLSKWVGEAERQLRLLFEQAKRTQPSIIFFDEIDGLAPVRSAKQDQIHASIVSTLLALMDGLDGRGRVIVIGATNRLDAIDPALRRPGRFDRELGFTLPNVEDRASMLQIHTKCWKPALAPAFRKELSQQLHGYCGADIKALCAEAALVALHRTYPQVYKSNNKLAINVDSIEVTRQDFKLAFLKVKPASHRSHQTLAQPLPSLLIPLLENVLFSIVDDIVKMFPVARVRSFDRSSTALPLDPPGPSIYMIETHEKACHECKHGGDELIRCNTCSKVFHSGCLPSLPENETFSCPTCTTSTLAIPMTTFPCAQSTRILLHGAVGMGQNTLLGALLYRFEHLMTFSLDLPSLLSDVNFHTIEEAMLSQLKEAKKSTPSIVVLPHVDVWWQHTAVMVHSLLEMFLQDCQHLPLLLIATSSTSYQELPKGLQALFGPNVALSKKFNCVPPSDDARRQVFQALFASFAQPPVVAKRAPPIPDLPPAAKPIKDELLVVDEALTLRHEQDAHHLRELRIFLSMVIDYCMTQKKNAPFLYPVDPDEVPTYYTVIKRPMDLSFMREKINDGEYDTYEAFLKDIQLIVRNANEFNPRGCPTRYVAHAAAAMQDNVLSFGHRFRQQQGYDLFAKCREISAQRNGEKKPRRFAPARKSRVIIEDDDEENEESGAANEKPEEDKEEASATSVVFAVGDKVFVQKRTMPGMNKLGGAGIVSQIHTDDNDGVESYSVKYVLGGLEKRIETKYMSHLTDDVVKESIKMTRQKAPADSEDESDEEQSKPSKLKDEYFDLVLWPTLYQEGWERVPLATIETRKKFIWVSKVPRHAPNIWTEEFLEENDDIVWFSNRNELLQYVKNDPELSFKCYGKRYFDDNGAAIPPSPRIALKLKLEEEHKEALERFNMTKEDINQHLIVVNSPTSPPIEEIPEFIYDEDAMFDLLQTIVKKSKNWSVDMIQSEVHTLHVLSQPHMQSYDRTQLANVSKQNC
ncbi:ATPase [Thraustotheca clavata]|uniref:ATPase n=1 Tax=Thraustotheca clavata TaxID=74557 RepID=A0A1V9YXK7_9STRA|nr:ATPase [Thraustotheca clavata]